MSWRSWEELPEWMKTDEVRPYYEMLDKKKTRLKAKRFFDLAASCSLIVLLMPLMGIIAVVIKADSKGPVLFRQERITQYGKRFQIYKFRTMTEHADKTGVQVTVMGDGRITKTGKFLRKYRLDELPQLFNIIKGEMTLVGARPEVVRYVKCYQKKMLASLLLPAGVTSMASIRYKEEDKLLRDAKQAEETYIRDILPEKMKWNLRYIREFHLRGDVKIMWKTIAAVLK